MRQEDMSKDNTEDIFRAIMLKLAFWSLGNKVFD